MTPNLPAAPVKAVLADRNISNETLHILKKLGIQVLLTIKLPEITDSTATHPDMQFAPIGYKKALVCGSVYTNYRAILPDYRLIPVYGIQSPYPNDSLLNITVIRTQCFATKYQQDKLRLDGFDYITVKQGYTKCNICILNENALITSDRSISSAAAQRGIRTYLLPDKEIELAGYNHGFWGGTCGLIDKDKLFFNGDITRLGCYVNLMKILEKEKVEPIYHTASGLCDIGSIIPLY
ncbi:MAG: hypothetical protein J6K66_00505 [Clostridia bacterium]|nr:hypothetical protein [Clostridia bacterium]